MGSNATPVQTHDCDRGGDEWRWLWSEVRPFTGYQAASLCLILAAVGVHATGPLLMKWLIDDILPNGRWPMLAGMTGLFLLVYVGSSVLSSLGRVINQLAVLRLVYRLRMRLLNHVQALPAAFHEKRPVGDLVRRIEEDVSLVGDLGSDVLPSITRMAVQSAVTVTAMAFMDWRLTCVIVPLLPLYAWVRHHYRDPLRRRSQQVREASGEQTSLLTELLTGAIQIQALGAERRLSRRYARLNLRTMRARWQQHNNEVLFTLASMSVVGLGIALIVGYGGARVMSGTLTAGSLVAFYGYMGLIFGPLMSATELYARINRVRASVTRLLEIERLPSGARDAPGAVRLPARPQRVVYTDVAFSYVAGMPALASIDFSVRAGERVALVGPSGCGKSSLLRLIPRFYDVDHGRVEIDGHDVRNLQLRSLREVISFVPQEPVLFQGTLRENLRHGSPTASTEEIDRALWITCLTDVIARLPQGLETGLGRAGSELSGGEKQRLAVARAILQDRPVLILDEATSALDARTEHRVLDRLAPWCADRIVIVVSHRRSALLWADRVVVLEKGRAVADQTPYSLRPTESLVRESEPLRQVFG